jgi:hypothetical protein
MRAGVGDRSGLAERMSDDATLPLVKQCGNPLGRTEGGDDTVAPADRPARYIADERLPPCGRADGAGAQVCYDAAPITACPHALMVTVRRTHLPWLRC